MMKALVCMCLIFSLLLSSCSKSNEESTEAFAEETEIETTKVEIWQKETVYENAVKDYLPFETSSWEREYAPEMVMIHFTSAVVLSLDDPYNKDMVKGIFEDYEIGINYVIDRDGTVLCYLPENRAAWHAGSGEFGGVEKYTNDLNRYSIGIEVLAMGSKADMEQYISGYDYDNLNPDFYGYTDAQYESLKLLVEDICDRYSIPKDRQHIIGHEEYSPDKTDPGELFDWSKIVE